MRCVTAGQTSLPPNSPGSFLISLYNASRMMRAMLGMISGDGPRVHEHTGWYRQRPEATLRGLCLLQRISFCGFVTTEGLGERWEGRLTSQHTGPGLIRSRGASPTHEVRHCRSDRENAPAADPDTVP